MFLKERTETKLPQQ